MTRARRDGQQEHPLTITQTHPQAEDGRKGVN
ncbi:hypothetical protein SAMN05216554_2750 [Herbiconiux ginsengi]|uniref:Uncharacterized protein n=1 Tax=Herbiconiux ginsengi TaxID=381665 RepID=A0A1H3QVK5_9MICO|nr:hypothetical protein SAMN05216554_2750 [Herbiconiux ginsengi]